MSMFATNAITVMELITSTPTLKRSPSGRRSTVPLLWVEVLTVLHLSTTIRIQQLLDLVEWVSYMQPNHMQLLHNTLLLVNTLRALPCSAMSMQQIVEILLLAIQNLLDVLVPIPEECKSQLVKQFPSLRMWMPVTSRPSALCAKMLLEALSSTTTG